MKLEDVRQGEVYIVTMFGRMLEVKIQKIDHKRQQFETSFGPVPFSSVSMMEKKGAK